jgi:hypothetical protein
MNLNPLKEVKVPLKSFRVKKTDLKKGPQHILEMAEAVRHDIGRAYPSQVYLSDEDYAYLRKQLERSMRKVFGRYATRKGIDYEVGLELLNLGPSTLLGKSIRPGYAVLDEDGLMRNIQNDVSAMAAEKAAEEAADLERIDRQERLERMNQSGVLGAVKGFFEKNFGDPRNLSDRL